VNFAPLRETCVLFSGLIVWNLCVGPGVCKGMIASSRIPILAVSVLGAWACAAEESKIAFDAYKHVIWIPVRVAGGPPLTFAFDSAAARSAIDWDRAEEQKLPFTALGERLNAGSGDGLARIGRTGAVGLTMPGAALDLPAIGVVPLRQVSAVYGRRMDGVVGAELLARYVVELDWEQRRMALHEPSAYRYSGEGAVLPLVVAGGMPFIRLQLSVPGTSPVEGLFLVDCPHPGTIIVNRPFVEENQLLEALRRNHRPLVTQFTEGVNGKSEVLYSRIAELKIGPFCLREPVAGFSRAKAGALAQTEFAGILGAEILRRFRVIFDFSRGRLILEPNSTLTQPYRYDASGIRLRSTGEDLREFVVTGVVENSPAAQAKLQEGDRLIEIDGRPAKTLSLGEILEILKRDGGTQLLRIQRGARLFDVSLVLRRLI